MRGTAGHHHPISSNFQHNHNNMLKVVGASWVKTRISTMIVAGSLLLAIGSLYFIVMERPALSGKYCATAYWSSKSSYRTQYWGQQSNLSLVKEGAARICYSDSTMTNGWSQIEIETHPDYADDIQAFAAGMLEGALTYASIYNHWDNTINAYCNADNDTAVFCDWLRETIEANVEYTKERAAELSDTDHYWHQIHLYFRQLDGLHAGWQQGVERAFADMELDAVELMLLNAAADIPDMRIYYENHVRESSPTEDHREYRAPSPKASMLLKFLTERSDNDLRPRQVLIGHSSDGHYSTMLRMLKRYKFHYHRSASASATSSGHRREVSGVSIAFTGYPGALSSSDDFYMAEGRRSKLTIGGIRMHNANATLWQLVDAEHGVLMAARVMAANRLAHDGYGWSRLMSRHPGFGTKQWMVVDVARMRDSNELLQPKTDANDSVVMASHVSTAGFELDEWTPIAEASEEAVPDWRNGLLWIVDQLPGRLHAEDVTSRIVGGESFWTGNGVPYFNETLQISGITPDDTTLLRSNMRVSQANITRLEDVAKVLRSRAYRGDLMGDGGGEEATKTFGNIDMKLYAETSGARMEFHAKAGPLYYSAQHVGCSSAEDGGSGEAQAAEVAATTTRGGDTAEDLDEIDERALSEIDVYAERRSVRDDMRAVAKMHSKHGPFRWSQTDLADGHSGHPDVFDFGAVSPQWAWSMAQQAH